jgi:hypothetical protein
VASSFEAGAALLVALVVVVSEALAAFSADLAFALAWSFV